MDKALIIKTFFDLLETKSYEVISVKEIVEAANVSRMSYSRHFNDKIDIVKYFCREMVLKEMDDYYDLDTVSFWDLEYGTAFFTVAGKYSKEIRMLNENGFSGQLLHSFNLKDRRIMEAKHIPDEEIYRVCATAGAAFNSMLMWVDNDCDQTPEFMAKLVWKK